MESTAKNSVKQTTDSTTHLCDNDVSGLTKAVTAVKTLIFSRWIPSLSTAAEYSLNTPNTELHLTRHNLGHVGGVHHSQSLDWYWETKQYKHKLNTTQKQQTTQNTAKQNYPGSVTFYDTRTWNEIGLFYKTRESRQTGPKAKHYNILINCCDKCTCNT